jgi:hypothetical protein
MKKPLSGVVGEISNSSNHNKMIDMIKDAHKKYSS